MSALGQLAASFQLYVGVVAMVVIIAFWRFLSTGRALIGTVVLVTWLLYAGILGAVGVIRGQWLGIPGMFVLVAPVFTFVAMVLVRSPAGRALALSIPVPFLIGLQTFRVGVELIIHKLWELGSVPTLLTLNGGNVEILVGLSAPAVAWISRKGPAGRRLTLAWSAFGLLSLINVASRAVLTSPGPLQWIHSEVPNLAMGMFPFTYIPGFMAPLAVMLHVLAIRGLHSTQSHSIINGRTPVGQAAAFSLPPNPVVLVTGASRGIGRETALAYARRGARLVLAARTAEALAAVGREVEATGAEVLALPTDITSPAAIDRLIAGAIERFGRIDVLVNNAGIGRVGAVTDADFEPDVHATLNASLFGMIRLTQRVVPMMRARNSGAIVNMSSVMGRKAFARFGSYAIVMHAVSAFSDALRQELTGTGIHVAVIHPALTATELLRDATVSEMPPPFKHMTPLSAEKVAAAVVSAVTRRQRRAVLPWQANMLLLGEALSPWIGDLIARALTIRFIAKLLGMSRGPTYHDTLARTPVARSASATYAK